MPDEQQLSPRFNAEDADFHLKSDDGVVFAVHRCILAMASDVFRTMLSVPQPKTPCSEPNLPCVKLSESASTLEILFQFVYPMKSPSYLNFDQYAKVLEAATKYEIEGAVDALRVLLLSPRVDAQHKSTPIRPALVEIDPLRAYAIATSMNWKAEAVHASHLTLRTNLHQASSSPELDEMPTKYYRWLNELHEERRTFFKRLFEEFDDEPSEYRIKQCKECGVDPIKQWWEEYIQRASGSVSSRPLGDKVFDLNVLFPPEDEIVDFGCGSCPPRVVPLQTLYALSKLKFKLSRKKENVRHKMSNSDASAKYTNSPQAA